MDWPAGLLNRMTYYYNIYQAMRGYKYAVDAIKWIEHNQEAYEIVTSVWRLRKEMGLHFFYG